MVTADTNWLASHLDDPNIVIIDTRGLMSYRFGHIKNSVPLGVDQVISISHNGFNLVIEPQTAEKIFTDLGIENSKTVVVYGEFPYPSATRIVWTLIYFGHPNVKLLDVAFTQWQKLGLPVNKQVQTTAKKIPTEATTPLMRV